MERFVYVILFLLIIPVDSGLSQGIGNGKPDDNGWARIRKIMDCAPRLVDRRDLVEDNFEHRYVTNNPRDIEVGYFSVEPITYLEQGRRFCEALLPAAGVSETYFRGCYITTYQLPGDGMYEVNVKSRVLIFNNDIRIINAQATFGAIEASHRLEIELDTALNPAEPSVEALNTSTAYNWELEIDPSGIWRGEVTPGDFEFHDTEIPAGFSTVSSDRKIRGPGVVTIRESVIFQVRAVSAYKYDPIFQAPCLFSFEPLSVSTRLLPCESE